LENLQQEEELIRSSQHPILISLEENVEIAKKIRMAQAKHKFEQLGVYLDRLLVERQQRIWDTWKVRFLLFILLITPLFFGGGGESKKKHAFLSGPFD
jgi:hypothetical protein